MEEGLEKGLRYTSGQGQSTRSGPALHRLELSAEIQAERPRGRGRDCEDQGGDRKSAQRDPLVRHIPDPPRQAPALIAFVTGAKICNGMFRLLELLGVGAVDEILAPVRNFRHDEHSSPETDRDRELGR